CSLNVIVNSDVATSLLRDQLECHPNINAVEPEIETLLNFLRFAGHIIRWQNACWRHEWFRCYKLCLLPQRDSFEWNGRDNQVNRIGHRYIRRKHQQSNNQNDGKTCWSQRIITSNRSGLIS